MADQLRGALPRGAALRFAIALLGFPAALSPQLLGQEAGARYWVAGRYDGNRVVVYFNAVRLGHAIPSGIHGIAPPVAELFFDPVELPPDYAAGLQGQPDAERFAVGDRYDLLLGNGAGATIRLTTLVLCRADEETGNDSFLGALATVEPPAALLLTHDYYAVRRRREPPNGQAAARPETSDEFATHAGLVDGPIQIGVETGIARLLDRRMKSEATAAERALAGAAAAALQVQAFRTATGALRYYARADWKSGKEGARQRPYSLGAWISPQPSLHIMALENRTTGYGDLGLPGLLNVVDLGDGKTGVIMEVDGDDSRLLELASYREGVSLKGMPVLQSIGAGE